MAQLWALAKGNYYPFPEDHLKALASLIAPANRPGTFIDPCAGEGEAAVALAQAWGLTPYLNELDTQRAAICQQLVGAAQAVQGDAMRLHAPRDFFDVGWINPPYTLDGVGPEKRRELSILKHAWPWIRKDGGLILWCVYAQHISVPAARWISQHASEAHIWRLPGRHQERYVHVVLVARVGIAANPPALEAELLRQVRDNDMRPLIVQEHPSYVLPRRAPPERVITFLPGDLDPTAIAAAVNDKGAQHGVIMQDILRPHVAQETISPVVPPRGRQFAMLLMAGIFDGIVLRDETQRRFAIRSTIETSEVETEHEVEDTGDETQVYQTRSVVTLSLLREDGTHEQIVGDTRIMLFIRQYRDQLMAVAERDLKPLYTFDYAGIEDVLAYPKNGNLYPTQRHVIAALYQTFQRQRTVILCGEPGSGKSVMGATVGAALAHHDPNWEPDDVILATCPPHLVRKWKREVSDAVPGAQIHIANRIDDVAAFMRATRVPKQPILTPKTLLLLARLMGHDPSHLGLLVVLSFHAYAARRLARHRVKVMILSREYAKLGEGWEPAIVWRNQYHRDTEPASSDSDDTPPSKTHITRTACCPTCGTPVCEQETSHASRRGQGRVRRPGQGGTPYPTVFQPHSEPAPDIPKERLPSGSENQASLAWWTSVPRTCHLCDSPLWSMQRTFSKPKTNLALAERLLARPDRTLRNPRVALAHYIAQRHKRRIGLFVADEVHQNKDPSSDQGEAFMVLSNAAKRVLPMTGTLYNGTASSLYAIEYTVNAKIRAQYPWGSVHRWVRNMGRLQRTVETKTVIDSAGKYSGTRRVEQRPREIPGTSPLMLATILDHVVMVGLRDMGVPLPDFEETPVELIMPPAMRSEYDAGSAALKRYLHNCRENGDNSFLGKYLQTLLSWPNATYRPEIVSHVRTTADGSLSPVHVHTWNALHQPEEPNFKDLWLIDQIKAELSQGRNVAVYIRQTGTRDIQGRVASLIKHGVPGARPYILRGKIKPLEREEVLARQIGSGANVLICNPKLVETGLDLLDFPTLIFYESLYSLYTMAQAARRAWRLNQTQACKVFYPYWKDSMEHRAVTLLAAQTYAANLLYGEATDAGLSILAREEGGMDSLIDEIATLPRNDLSTLFRRQISLTHESAWLEALEKADMTRRQTIQRPTLQWEPYDGTPRTQLALF